MRSKRVSRRLLSDRVDSVLLVHYERLVRIRILVDNATHAFLTVATVRLRAVVPDRVFV